MRQHVRWLCSSFNFAEGWADCLFFHPQAYIRRIRGPIFSRIYVQEALQSGSKYDPYRQYDCRQQG